MGKTITSIILVLLLIVGGFWMFNRMDDEFAVDNDANVEANEDLTGTGGPDEGYDPLEELEVEGKG